MRKLSVEPLVPLERRRRHGTAGRLVAVVVLGLLLAPLLYESLSLCVAQWRGLYGPIEHVETPVLDALGHATGEAARVVRWRFNRTFHDLPWKPSVAIGLGIGWAAIMAFSLHRHRP